MPRVARPLLQELADALLDTVHLAVEDSGQVLYLDKINGQRGAEMRSRIGQRMPLTRTGVGMALLLDRPGDWTGLYEVEIPAAAPTWDTGRFVSRMRRYSATGVTFDLEDNEIGIRCVAAPVRDGTRRIVAAISVAATTPYMPRARMRALVPVMLRTSQQISRRLGHIERQRECQAAHTPGLIAAGPAALGRSRAVRGALTRPGQAPRPALRPPRAPP